MAEYIDRGAFVQQCRELYCTACDRRKGMKNGRLQVLYEIGEAPCRACEINDILTDAEFYPAADVVEVVRCRDCKHAPLFWDEDDPFAVKWPQEAYAVDDETCPHFVGDYGYTRPPDPDGFCEKGERKP